MTIANFQIFHKSTCTVSTSSGYSMDTFSHFNESISRKCSAQLFFYQFQSFEFYINFHLICYIWIWVRNKLSHHLVQIQSMTKLKSHLYLVDFVGVWVIRGVSALVARLFSFCSPHTLQIINLCWGERGLLATHWYSSGSCCTHPSYFLRAP